MSNLVCLKRFFSWFQWFTRLNTQIEYEPNMSNDPNEWNENIQFFSANEKKLFLNQQKKVTALNQMRNEWSEFWWLMILYDDDDDGYKQNR